MEHEEMLQATGFAKTPIDLARLKHQAETFGRGPYADWMHATTPENVLELIRRVEKAEEEKAFWQAEVHRLVALNDKIRANENRLIDLLHKTMR